MSQACFSRQGIFGRGVAQRLAHLVRDQGVGGSNPLTPTMDTLLKCEVLKIIF